MERKIKVERINSEGKTIDMEIPVNLLSLYTNAGWRKVEKKVVTPKRVETQEPIKLTRRAREEVEEEK